MIQHAALKYDRSYLLRTEITKSHLNKHICQHRGMKTSTVTPSFYYVFNISLYCNDTIPSFIGNLWQVLLLGNHLKNIKFPWGNYQPIVPRSTATLYCLNKSGFVSQEDHSGCKSQNIAIGALKGNVLCQIWFKWTY